MELPAELRVIHEPTRLRILTALYRQNDVGYAALRSSLGITAGNLASHTSKLVESGLIQARDALARSGFEKRYQITRQGIDQFEKYLTHIERFVASTRTETKPALPSPAPASKGHTIAGAVFGGLFFILSEFAIQFFSDTSGSTYLGIGAAGLIITAIGPLRGLYRRRLP